ncbi:MAG: low molecular weight phosphotyrosine protein phosphatase [Erysipelotrichaceae bacterium]|nr:low molecular weight phosphotyrosine protein phosphatase [Erysipelotrichaceae bacterium]
MKERSILFVCHGNICRSVMAEYILKSMTPEIRCASRAVSYEEEGRDIYFAAKQCLDRHGIAYERHHAKVITQDDYDSFNEIYVMDHENLNGIRWLIDDPEHKIHMLAKKEIDDPWYTDRFDEVFEEIREAIENIL